MEIQKTKNTLNIDYEYDKLNNVGQFALTYRKDNQTVKVNENDNVSIYYFKEGKGDLHLVSNPKIVGGQVKFDQASMSDSLSSGVYDIYSTIGSEIYPSQGYVKIKLETHVENGVQVTVLTGPKGDPGEVGQAGKDAPTITGVNYTNNNLIFTLSDNSIVSTTLTLPAGPKGDPGQVGQAGKDAPKIDSVTLNGNVLTFTLSDSTKYNINLPLLKGDPGETGQAGKDAPVITNVNYQNSQLIFTLSDSSTISTPLTLPTGPKGDTGEKGSDGLSAYEIAKKDGFSGTEQEWLASLKGQKGDPGLTGQAGKDAPKVTSVNYQDNSLTFTLSDNSNISAPLTLPTGPRGEKGDPGQAGEDAPTFTNVNYQNGNLTFTLSDKSTISTPLALPTGPKGDTGLTGQSGKDAPKIDNVSLNDNVLTFALSDSSKYAVNLPLLKGDDGQNGKDAPKITSVNYQNGQLVFTLSDGTNVSTPLALPNGPKGDPGEKGSDGLSAYQLAVKNGFKGSETEWLASLKGETGPQGPAGQDGGGSKLKRVYYDGMVRHKAIFENDDGTSIESNIFSEPTLPANPKNLTRVRLYKDAQPQSIKPQALNAGLADTVIHTPFILHNEAPTFNNDNYGNLDIHLDTSNLLDRRTGVTFKMVTTVDDFVKHQWLAKEASVSADGKTVAVKILPVINGSTIYLPKFDHHWHDYPYRVFMTTYSYNQIPNLVGTDDDFSSASGLRSMGLSNNFAFSRVDKISILWFSESDYYYDIIMLLYSSDKPQVWVDGSALALKNGTVTPINYTFTGYSN